VEKRPPYLIRRKGRLGQAVFYVWRRPGPQIRLREPYGTRAFWAEYRAALYGEAKPVRSAKDEAGSLSAMIAAYRRSPAWARLAETTRKGRGNMLDRIAAKAGDMAIEDVDQKMVAAGRDAMSGPGAAKCFIDTLRGFYKWAIEAGHVDDDPTQAVKRPSVTSDGYETWTDADIAAYEARWPMGTSERLWLALLLYTGLRRSDAIRLEHGNIRGECIETVTQKTGTPVILPLHPELKAVLDATPLGERSFIGLHVDTFAKRFRKACDAAGVSKSAHGLRKAAAVRLAEAGATVLELNAWFGWEGGKEALRYTAKSDRAKLARSGMERLRRVTASE
jgi:integrase